MVTAFLGLGSNLGNREQSLEDAIVAINETIGIHVIQRSSIYETEPVGVTTQPMFLNLVLKIETNLDPQMLLSVVKQIETRLGRQPRYRWGPREIDIDILLYDELEVNEPNLRIPHPRMWEREFVLNPLREIAPEKVP
jgi:2-amino-4-hydroxy-6-hydroxymethyldihydropteridine diphosphokinase